jgi:hypothetical protein
MPSLIDKRQLESLKMIGEADKYAKQLLAIAPDAADAYLGLGTANSFIGSLPGLKKFFIGIAGTHGDKKTRQSCTARLFLLRLAKSLQRSGGNCILFGSRADNGRPKM